ncbi:MAG: hypothetical protein ACM3X6_03735 [Patescibacteria group bacterium]
MLYQLPVSPASRSPLLARDRSYFDDDFMVDLREFICSRLDRVDTSQAPKEYHVQQEKASRLYAQLREMLPEEGQRMLLQYSEALGSAHYLETAMLGERAFLDGMRLLLRAMMNDECRMMN